MARGLGRFLRQNTVAMLALFIALTGTTFAASMALPTNSVGTKQLKNNAVTAPKIKNGVVTGAKIAKNAVNGAKVADNSITGGDVNEATLAKVPAATAADTATNATHATSADNATNLGGQAASFYAPKVLQHGQSESGTYAVATGTSAGGFLAQGFAFPIPLPAALDASHVAWLNGTTTTNCPGVGQAAAGWLCVYASAAASVSPDNGHAVNTHGGFGGADSYGFMLFFDATASNAFSYGSWTVSAP